VRNVRDGKDRVAAAWHIAADRIDRDMAMAENDSGQGLDLEIEHGVALLLREVAHLCLSKLDVLDITRGDLRYGALDLGGREMEILRRPFVELLRQFADGDVLPFFDLGEDGLHGRTPLCVGGRDVAVI